MGGAISVVAVETRVQMDSTGRVCLVETATPLHFGQSAGHRGFNFSDSRLLENGSARDDRQLFASPPLLLGTIRSSRRHDGRPFGGSSLTRGFDDDDEGMTSIQIGGVRPQRSRLPLRDTDGEGARSRGRSAERVSLVAGERMLMLAEALFNMLEDMEEHLAHSQEPKGAQPAPAGVVDRLPMRTYEGQPSVVSSKGKGKSSMGEGGAGEAEDESLEECYVCLAEYEAGDSVRTLPCMHEFHAQCVDKWLKEVHNACPLCRASVCTSRQTAPRGFEAQRERSLRPTLALEHPRASAEETLNISTTPPARAAVVARAQTNTNGGHSCSRTGHSSGISSSRRSGSPSSPVACEINANNRIPASRSTTSVRRLRTPSAYERESSQP
mmetsp:Transcript_21575/g.41206  ORF Transcript_21575/g.41206 Transcript_21575/m.41206 type:complete len:383 (-) Transcript_21575:317-1465(-)|eukprot:CAMPEP_0114241590 /NCGR_PEP_ID=MMETSP0058-20121206/9710_1 /TAXON_ID=36894 /ORGANISM="Pyramimonas parkeae, CCMP726" /LENGTH=382 /DNA_ID=CAMNT_0001354119 /DNA_START=259 /DNA_END=1407 /DNA_ORIENTATION=+